MPTSTTSPSRCPQLLDVADLRLYEENPFRVTGLPATATNKEIARQAEKLKQFEELGYGGSANPTAFALNPPPSTDAIREAIQRLKDPEKRIVDEFFWFWPVDAQAPANDRGLKAVSTGDVSQALTVWVEEESNPTVGSVAAHNIAITQHLYAMDKTLEQISSGHEEDLSTFWTNAIERWNRVAASDVIWDYLKLRIAALNDPRLTTGLVRRMESALPEALMKIHAEAALKLAEKGNMELARQHVQYMRMIKAEPESRERVINSVLEPVRDHLKTLAKDARDKSAADAAGKGSTAVNILIQQCTKADPLLELFYGRGSSEINDHQDQMAEAISFCAYRLHEVDGRLAESLILLRQALMYAHSDTNREKLKGDVVAVEGQVKNAPLAPLYEILQVVNDDKKGKCADRFGKLKNQAIPKLQAYARSSSADPELLNKAAENTSWVIRTVALDSANNEHNIHLSREALNLAVTALTLSTKPDPELLKRLKNDLTTLAEMERDALCHFCGKNEASDTAAFVHPMHGEVKKEWGGKVTFKRFDVKVPRCLTCAGEMAEKDRVTKKWMVIFMIPSAMVALCILAAVQGFTFWGMFLGFIGTIFVGSVLGQIAAGIAKPLNLRSEVEYSVVRDLRAKGWRAGAQPPNTQ